MRLNPAAWPGQRHEEALAKMVEDVVAATKDCEHRILAISHCNCPERAQYVKLALRSLPDLRRLSLWILPASQACMQMTEALL